MYTSVHTELHQSGPILLSFNKNFQPSSTFQDKHMDVCFFPNSPDSEFTEPTTGGSTLRPCRAKTTHVLFLVFFSPQAKMKTALQLPR